MYNPHSSNDPLPVSAKPRASLQRREAFTLFPIGLTLLKNFRGCLQLQGQAYHCRHLPLLANVLHEPELGGSNPPRDGVLAEVKRESIYDGVKILCFHVSIAR